MKVQVPSDFDFDQESSNRFSLADNWQHNENQIRKKKPKIKFNLRKFKSRNQPLKLPNYFQQMYKQTKKKVYINVFVRKLKQLIVQRTNFSHYLFQEQSDPYHGSIKTLKLKSLTQEILMVLFILSVWIFSLLITLEVSFSELRKTQELRYFFIIANIGILTETCLKIFTVNQINIQKSSKNSKYLSQSAIKYFWSWMGIDCIIFAIIIADIVFQNEWLMYCKLLFLIKIIPATEKMNALQIKLIQNNFRMQYWQLAKIIIFNFIFGHFLAITLILLANEESSWITVNQFQDMPWNFIYIWAYYWAVNIMLTVGFGDISATNVNEALGMIFIQTLSCIMLAYNINKVGNIIKKINSYEEQKISDLKIFSQMQSREGVSDDIKKKITNFITESAEIKKKFNVEEEQNLLKKLPKNFYDQFKQESSNHIFKTLPFFRCLRSKKLQQIAIKIEKKLAHPQQILIESNTVPKIWIVNKGKLSLNMHKMGLKNHGRQIQYIQAKENQYKLLSQKFLTNECSNYDVKCKNYTITFSMSDLELRTILQPNQYCYQYYCMSRDIYRYNPNDLQIQQCTICSNQSYKSFHTLFDCPHLHYIPLKRIVIQKALKKGSGKCALINGFYKKRIPRTKFRPLRCFAEMRDFLATFFQFTNSHNLDKIPAHQIKNQQKKSKRLRKKQIKSLELQKITTLNSLKSLTLATQQESKNTTVNNLNQTKYPKTSDTALAPSYRKIPYFQWQIECDCPQNYEHYFPKQNPSNIHNYYNRKTLDIPDTFLFQN